MTAFKDFESKAWEAKAEHYDKTWGRVSGQVIQPILELIGPLEQRKLLDCGCGPGRLCAAAGERGADAIGCDYSRRMVEIAKGNYPNRVFHVEDAEKMSFAEGSFDIVTMNFLLLHVSDQEKTLLEGQRVVAPGGMLIFSMWLPPVASPGLALMFNAVREYADLTVIPPAQDIFTFARHDYCKAFLLKNGFRDVRMKRVESYWDVETPDEFFEAVQAGTRIGGTIERQQPAIKAKIKGRIFSEIAAFRCGSRYIIPTPSLVVAAVKC